MEEAVDGGNAATVRDHMQKQEGSRKKSSDLSHLPSSHLLLLLISVLTQVEARQQVDRSAQLSYGLQRTQGSPMESDLP